MSFNVDTSSLSAFLSSAFQHGVKSQENPDITTELFRIADKHIQDSGLRNTPEAFPGPQDRGHVFVVTPFSDKYVKNFEAIQKVCGELRVSAERVDTNPTSGSIIDRIQKFLKSSEFVIVDLSEARPNVYYELGYFDAVCEARGESSEDHLLLVAHDIPSDAHFDVRHRGIRQYDDAFDLMKIVEGWLKARLS